MVGSGGDDSIFQEVAGFQAEDADGFYPDVLIGQERRRRRDWDCR